MVNFGQNGQKLNLPLTLESIICDSNNNKLKFPVQLNIDIFSVCNKKKIIVIK